ncbi:MAG: hypothetical protein RJA81_1453 [Planctomycetota bacterium]
MRRQTILSDQQKKLSLTISQVSHRLGWVTLGSDANQRQSDSAHTNRQAETLCHFLWFVVRIPDYDIKHLLSRIIHTLNIIKRLL